MIAVTGVLPLAVAAFAVSYAGIRQIAVAAGVPPARAGLYPLIVDAVLVVACVAASALRGAGWQLQGCAWLSVLVLFAAAAVAGAVHAAGVSLRTGPPQPRWRRWRRCPGRRSCSGSGCACPCWGTCAPPGPRARPAIRAPRRGGPGPQTQIPPRPLPSRPGRSRPAAAPIRKPRMPRPPPGRSRLRRGVNRPRPRVRVTGQGN